MNCRELFQVQLEISASDPVLGPQKWSDIPTDVQKMYSYNKRNVIVICVLSIVPYGFILQSVNK